MANVNHSTLTDPYLHEPKGIATAGTGQVYVANGTGSGTWVENHRFIGAYIPFDAVTPAYSHSATTSATVINPTFTVSESNGFTGTSSPNARLTYTGTEDITSHMVLTLSTRQASGSTKMYSGSSTRMVLSFLAHGLSARLAQAHGEVSQSQAIRHSALTTT
jgi:hypothetical protein